MIKLILTDMDGTLLRGNHELPEKTLETIRRLMDQQIRFGIASGREYNNLREYFPGLADEMIMVADNGTLIYDKTEEIYLDVLRKEEVEKIVKELRKLPGVWIVLCGKKMSYIECRAEDRGIMESIAHNFYENVELTEDVCERTDREQIMEISIFCENGAAMVEPQLKWLEKDYQVFVSGSNWIDILNKSAGKGNAVKLLQQRYGWQPEECMAFGDYFNDIAMLQNVGESYAMANAQPDVQAAAKYLAPSNEEGGVIRVLRERFQLEEVSGGTK